MVSEDVASFVDPIRGTHGLASTYQHYGCRCEACTKAAREHMQRWREAKRGYRIERVPIELDTHD